jgi:phosphonate transport system substrate-binding protein
MNWLKQTILGTLAIATLASSMPSYADLTMGVFPRRPASATNKFFRPLADHLAKELGEPVKLVISKSFKAFWQGVEKGKFDIVHFNQYHYLLANEKFGYQVFAANEEQGSQTIAGALSVRTDSGINSVAELKGKTILFGGGKKAMGSYIATTAILKKNGLKEGADYTAKFAKNPPGAVISVFHKAAEAAGTGNIILKVGGVTKKIDVTQMKILAESEPFVHLPWATKKGMDAGKAQKIADLMISMKKGDPILKSAKVTGFFATSDADFAKVREIVDFALAK